MTLLQVATKTGLSVSFLSDLEHGRTAPSVKTLERLSCCYNVSTAYLLGEETTNTNNEEALYREIGARIRAEREDLGFDQIELAEHIGLTRTSITNIEAGRQRMLIHTLYALADALGVSITCLLPNNDTTQ
jgi:transcriptional regulator with XRE-family HTH domain